MPNFYLPKKDDVTVQHTLTTADTYSWTAPDANGDSTTYVVDLEMIGAGAGGSCGSGHLTSGAGGGSGAFTSAKWTVTPGNTYTLRVGAGGTGHAGQCCDSSADVLAGNSGESSYIKNGSTMLLEAGGGSGGGAVSGDGPTVATGGAGGTVGTADSTVSIVLSKNGAKGGNGGYTASGSDDETAPTAGGYVSGSGYSAGSIGSGSCKDASGGGGAGSWLASGGNGGASNGTGNSNGCDTGCAGGGGGAGYTKPATPATKSTDLWSSGPGGNGTDGFIKISYTLHNGESDNAPTT